MPHTYIKTTEQLHEWLDYVKDAQYIAVDTESDRLYGRRRYLPRAVATASSQRESASFNPANRGNECICLVQMTAKDEDVLIDPLALPFKALAALEQIFLNPAYLKIFHDAGFDLRCLQRDFGFTLVNLFDTMWASRLLGYRQFGLAHILKERYQFLSDKRLQRSRWGKRPLTPEQLCYAQADTHFLPALYRDLKQELAAKERWLWALEDFNYLTRYCLQPGVKIGLDKRAQDIYEALRILRREQADKLQLEAEVALSNLMLKRLAVALPLNFTALRQSQILGEWRLKHFGEAILTVLKSFQVLERALG